MIMGRVVGTVVSTRKEESLDGLKFLVVQNCDFDGHPGGSFVVAADAVGAGLGEVVLYASGSSARQTVQTKERPCDATIMAIVDTVEVGGEELPLSLVASPLQELLAAHRGDRERDPFLLHPTQSLGRRVRDPLEQVHQHRGVDDDHGSSARSARWS